RAYLGHHRFVAAYRSPFDEAPRLPSPSFRKAQALMRPGHQLSEHAAKQLLRAYGIRVPREQLVTSAAAAVRAASQVGYPVVMKASGAQIAHKTELGLVKVELTSASQVRDAYRHTLLGSSRLATFRTFGNCITAVRAYLGHHRFTAAYHSPFDDAPRTPSSSARKARGLLHPGTQLSEHAAKQLLRAYGIRVPREQLVTSAAGSVRAAGLVGYPVVMKASGAQIAHKTELGLVKVGLTSASQVRDAYRELTDIARYEGVDLDGILVCQMVERGVEMVLGVTHDPLFGPTVTAGLGGVLVEVLRDTAVRVPPFGDATARDMLRELRGARLLDGVRGAPPADVDGLVDIILRVQRMAMELGDSLAELDINPLMVLPRGQGAVALDALAVCR
ncbi:MAG: hypothetical protein QOF44_3769, partial [Streptomyces sp.]|nr:hypothetical protein [Streptomyces sp.]